MASPITREQLARAKNGLEVQLASYQGLVAAGEILAVLEQAVEDVETVKKRKAEAEAELAAVIERGKQVALEFRESRAREEAELAKLRAQMDAARKAGKDAEVASAEVISNTARKTKEALQSLEQAHLRRSHEIEHEQRALVEAGRKKVAAAEAEVVALGEALVEMRQEASALEARARAVLAHGGV